MSEEKRVPKIVRKSFEGTTSMTEQSHKDSCDIVLIMNKAQKTGMVQHLAKNQGQYMDLASRPDYHEAMNIIAEAKSTFETIPPKIREKFHNDPSEFLEFIQDKENRAEMLELGFTDDHLPPKEEEPPPGDTPPVDPPGDPQGDPPA